MIAPQRARANQNRKTSQEDESEESKPEESKPEESEDEDEGEGEGEGEGEDGADGKSEDEDEGEGDGKGEAESDEAEDKDETPKSSADSDSDDAVGAVSGSEDAPMTPPVPVKKHKPAKPRHEDEYIADLAPEFDSDTFSRMQAKFPLTLYIRRLDTGTNSVPTIEGERNPRMVTSGARIVARRLAAGNDYSGCPHFL
jgi:hypothetical protein